MIAYLILFARFCRVVFAYIRWILVYFYCFVHTVKVKGALKMEDRKLEDRKKQDQ